MKPTEYPVNKVGRLDATVRSCADLSNKRARDVVRTGKVSVDGVRVVDPAVKVKPGQTIRLDWAAPNPKKNMPHGLELIYRDADLLVVNKPAGLLSTPTSEEEPNTAAAGARRFCRGGKPPLVVHRLDKDTSGLLVFGRGQTAARALRNAIDSKSMTRMYRCVTRQAPRTSEGTICSFLVRDAGRGRRGSFKGSLTVLNPDTKPIQTKGTGKWSVTRYRTVDSNEKGAALEVWLETGRTHQIRIHLAEIGCPIVGEKVYAKRIDTCRQVLHAARLVVPHPRSGELMEFESSWPTDLGKVTPIGKGW